MPTKRRTLLVGVGSVAHLDPALDPAIRLAWMVGARLYVVHATMLPEVRFPGEQRTGLQFNGRAEGLRLDMERALERRVRLVTGDPEVVARVVVGDPATALDALANRLGAELLIIGRNRRGVGGSDVLGSTAQRILRHSRVPVFMSCGRGLSDGAREEVPEVAEVGALETPPAVV